MIAEATIPYATTAEQQAVVDTASGNPLWRWVIMVTVVALVIVGSLLVRNLNWLSLDAVKAWMTWAGPWGPIAFVAAYAASSFLLVPAWTLSVASGALWGPTLGTAYTVSGATMAAAVPFFVSRRWGRPIAERMMMKNRVAGVCDRMLSRRGFESILVMRLLPVFPWDLVNYGAGLCGIRFKDFMLGTFLGIIPASYAYNLIGANLGEPDSSRALILAAAAILLAVPVLYYRRANRRA